MAATYRPKAAELNEATDQLAEVLADFDLSDGELIACRADVKKRVDKAQKLLLGLRDDEPLKEGAV